MSVVAGMFNADKGEIKIYDQIWLKGGLSMEKVESMGVVFRLDPRIKEGWVHRVCEPCIFQGEKTYLSLSFYLDRLASAVFGFEWDRADPIADLTMYRDFLERELGSPSETRQDKLVVLYRYTWGEIEASYDPWNGASGMTILWNAEFPPFKNA